MSTRTVKIGDLASKERGAFKIGPFGSSLKQSELVDAGIPVVGIENVLPNQFEKGFRRFVTPAKFEELSDYEITQDDVLVTTMGTIGRAAVVPPALGTAIFDSHLFRMRVDTERVFPPYLCYALNSNVVDIQLQRMARGAIMQGLNTTILRECEISLPDVPQQKRIAAQLEQADRLRRTCRYARELSDTFLPATFLELFGDPRKTGTRWDAEQLENVGSLDRGKSKHRPRNAPHLYGGAYPFIQTGDVANAERYVRSHTQSYSEEGLKQSKLWPAGTLCITIAANIGETAILTYPACFPDSIVGFVPEDRVKIEFVQFWFHFLQETLERTAPEVAQKNINLEILRELRCPIPPLSLQEKFVAQVRSNESLRMHQREALRQADHLFQSVLHQTFAVTS